MPKAELCLEEKIPPDVPDELANSPTPLPDAGCVFPPNTPPELEEAVPPEQSTPI